MEEHPLPLCLVLVQALVLVLVLVQALALALALGTESRPFCWACSLFWFDWRRWQGHFSEGCLSCRLPLLALALVLAVVLALVLVLVLG